jgi:lysophospholipase L1-like esterase
MARSGSRWLGTARHGPRRMAVVAVVAVAVAGCQAAAGAAAGRSAASGAGRSAASPAGRSAAEAPPRPTPPALVLGRQLGGSPRIMIVGDSITEGSSGDYTWQYWLYEHLRADGVSPQMVGPYHWLFNNVTKVEGDRSYANPRFEHANDARWGMALFREKDVIGAKVATYRPDYLLVLLGLDDIYWFGISQPDMAANLAGFVAAARAARPHIRIVLGLIPPDIHQQTDPAFAASVATYNHTIASTASQLSTIRSPIAVARDGTSINVAADLWDGTHPNANGEIKIAAAYASVLARRFHLGSAFPEPFPVLPTGPLSRPHLMVTPSRIAGRAKLSWTLVPGADGYRVYLKDLSRRGVRFRRLPWPLSPVQNPWTAGLLTPGDTYDFKLQACKGADCGAFSNVASVTAP